MTEPIAEAEGARARARIVGYRLADRAFIGARWILGLVGGFFSGTMIAGVILTRGVPIHARGPSPVPPSVLVVVVLASCAVGAWLFTRVLRSVTVGSDGVSFRRGYGRSETFVSFAEIEAAEGSAGFPGLPALHAMDLRVRNGGMLRIGGGSPDRVDFVVDAIRAGVAAWRERARTTEDLEGLRADGLRVDEWVARLRRRALGDVPYRDANLPFDELGAVVSNPSASPAQRLGAAIVLRARAASDAREHIRIAAADTASPRVRIALEAIARDADGAALEEHLAAVLEEDRAQRNVAGAP